MPGHTSMHNAITALNLVYVVVENLSKRREPLPTLSGVYFITPTEGSLNELMGDFKTRPLYRTAHVFFSTRIDPRILTAFRSQAPPALLSCLKSLKEVSSLGSRPPLWGCCCNACCRALWQALGMLPEWQLHCCTIRCSCPLQPRAHVDTNACPNHLCMAVCILWELGQTHCACSNGASGSCKQQQNNAANKGHMRKRLHPWTLPNPRKQPRP